MAPKPRKMLVTGGLQEGLMLVGQLDKNVFEAGSEGANLGDGDPVFQQLLAELTQVAMVIEQRVNRLAKNRGTADAGNLARITQSAGNFGSGDLDAQRAV